MKRTSTSNLLMMGCLVVGSLALASSTVGQEIVEDPVEAPVEVDDNRWDDNDESSDTGDGNTVDEILAGHSSHGDAFNEGPRQRAYLMETTGSISFPVTTESEEAQAFINQGIGQLHGFWYLEAERSFRQAAALDPECAMAYWGCALATKSKEDRAKGFMEEAMARVDSVTDRESRYIKALNKYFETDDRKERATDYTKALEDIALEYPEDLEAKVFLALQIYQNRSSNVAIGSYLAANALMQEIFEQQPDHPTHHFNIHLWDHRKPEMALHSAAMCGPSAPGIAHMWHMPGHIYSRLKRYEDAVWQQEASARVDHAHMMRDRVMPDEISNFAHNNEWLIRNMIFIGRVDDALALSQNMLELPRHPKYNSLQRRGSSRYGRERLFDVLTQFELWEEVVLLADTEYLEATDSRNEQLKRLRLIGAAYFLTGRVDQGGEVLVELQSMHDAVEETRQSKVDEAREKALAEIQKNEPDSDQADDAADEQTEDSTDDVASTDPSADDDEHPDVTEAIKEANEDVDKILATINKSIAAVEGYRLYHEGDAVAANEKFTEAGTEHKSFLHEVQFEAGDVDDAIKEATNYLRRHENEVLPLARLIYLLHKADRHDEALERLHQLRDISGSIEMKSHLFTRLNPIAADLGIEGDWRKPSVLADDVGERFALDQLGPFRWTPSPAPEWMLVDADGNLHSSKEFQGRPVVVIFYLGYGCLHCVEQLHEFAPRKQKFDEAGIGLIAISSDDQSGLRTSIDDYDQGLPIPLLSDAQLDVFRSFRAFDDFEGKPLHGTFLIDEDGMIRWQDISYQPFMEADFLLQEAQRLLSQEPISAVESRRVSTPAPQIDSTTESCESVLEAGNAVPRPADDELPLVYATSFELGADNWVPTDETAWEVKQTATGKVFSQHKKRSDHSPPHRSPLNIALLDDVYVGSFQIDVDVLSTHEDYGHRDVCLFFGYQSPAEFYYVHLGKQADPHANQIFIVNNADRTKISLTTTEGTDWDDNWHHVRIKRDASSGDIEVFFDDMSQPVMTAKDDSFQWGKVGLGSFDDTGDWDDFTLRGFEFTKPE